MKIFFCLELKMLQFFAFKKVTIDSHVIKDLGLDSLDHVEIIVQLEDLFGEF
jgi:acyl carrier protein